MTPPADKSIVRLPVDPAITGTASPPREASDPSTHEATEEDAGVRTLIWLYFWLLMFEGILRKWLLPGWSDALLIVRDPVLLLCYFVALRKGAFPRTAFMPWIVGLGAAAFILSILGIVIGATHCTAVVLLYGLRTNFGHLPLIFLIAQVFTRRDVEKVGKWLLLMAVPMVILIYLQFRAAPDAWVNAGAGLTAGQIGVAVSGVEKIRPAGVFSYNTGLATYLTLVAAFLSAHYLSGGKLYHRWLAILGTFALVASVPLALSRSTTGGLGIVAAASVLCILVRPQLFKGGAMVALLVGGAIVIVGSWSFFGEGLNILSARFEEGSGIKVGIVDRMLETFTKPVEILFSAPFLGAGLGVGTNVGAKVLSGQTGFLLSEGDWERDVDEMGPVVGTLYILLRMGLVGAMVSVAWRSLHTGTALSALVLSAAGLGLLNGNLAQPTSLGFAVFGGGLCLAAARDFRPEGLKPPPPSPEPSGAMKVRGRSVYAEQLHSARPPV